MSLKRRRRIAELLHEEISTLLQFDIRDPRIGFVTVTGVEVNADLTIAVVYVSFLDRDEQTEKEALAGLKSATPFLKRILGQKIRLRYIPDLNFKVDHSLAHAQKIHTLLAEIDLPPQSDDDPETDQ